jgi:acetyltransferase
MRIAKDVLNCLFTPRTVAIVGASNKDGKMGNLLVRNLMAGYSGQVFPIHPSAQDICGLQTYKDITDLPTPIDLLIPLIPAKQTVSLVSHCAKGQVKVLLAIPSGFGEANGAGKLLQEELLSLASERHMRVVGPNSAGVLNCLDGLNASLVSELPPGGPGFSCMSQSGGFGMAIYMYTHDHQLEMAKFCDLGNTADVTAHELLDYFRHDADTHVVGVYLESLVDQERFFAHVNTLAREKPVILTKLGRTDAGARASLAHIGIPAGDAHFQERVRDSRIIPAQTGLEMLEIAKGLSWQPLPRGGKVGILTGSGGVGAELADLCLEHGLEVPEFSPQLQAALRPYLPAYASVQNPVDLTPIWQEFPNLYGPLLRTFFASDEVDILLVAILDVATTLEPLMHAVTAVVAQARIDLAPAKPIYVYWASPHNMREHRQILQRARIPCYQSTLSAVRTAAAICHYAMQSVMAGG